MSEVKRSHKKKEVKAPAVDIRTVHRVTTAGPHRIEIHSPDAPPIIGDWAQHHEIARLKTYCATTRFFASVLPNFFRIGDAACRIVGDYPDDGKGQLTGDTCLKIK